MGKALERATAAYLGLREPHDVSDGAQIRDNQVRMADAIRSLSTLTEDQLAAVGRLLVTNINANFVQLYQAAIAAAALE